MSGFNRYFIISVSSLIIDLSIFVISYSSGLSIFHAAIIARLISSVYNFLFNKYTNIFNRLLKDEIDIRILLTFVKTLKQVEDGEVDQNEASVMVGKILKELYIDSALKREKKYEEIEESTGKKKKEKKPVNNVSWKKYKQMQVNR